MEIYKAATQAAGNDRQGMLDRLKRNIESLYSPSTMGSTADSGDIERLQKGLVPVWMKQNA